MKIFGRQVSVYTLLLGMLICLIGCQPLYFKIYIRNLSATPAILTIHLTKGEIELPDTVGVRYTDSVVGIRQRTAVRFTRRLPVETPQKNIIRLTIPAQATVFASDLARLWEHRALGLATLERHGVTDTFQLNYPYRRIKGVHRKRDRSYNYFYRTILWYDVE